MSNAEEPKQEEESPKGLTRNKLIALFTFLPGGMSRKIVAWKILSKHLIDETDNKKG